MYDYRDQMSKLEISACLPRQSSSIFRVPLSHRRYIPLFADADVLIYRYTRSMPKSTWKLRKLYTMGPAIGRVPPMTPLYTRL